MNLLGGPATHRIAAVQQHLQKSDRPGVRNFDAGMSHRPDGDRQSQPLEQREVHMNIEALRLEPGKAVGDDLESLAHRIQMIQSLFQAEVAQIVGAEFVAQVAGELLILFEKGVVPVSAENVMTMLDLVDHGGEFAAQAFVQAGAEDLADPVGRQPPEADRAASLKDFVNGEMAFEDEVAAVLDLSDGVESRQVHLGSWKTLAPG